MEELDEYEQRLAEFSKFKVSEWFIANDEDECERFCEKFRGVKSTEHFKQLLNSNISPWYGSCNCCGNTSLHLTAMAGHYKVLEWILSCRTIDINMKNDNGETPLHVACNGESLQIITLLIAYGADANTVDDAGTSAVQLCLAKNKTDMAIELLDNGAEINDYFEGRFLASTEAPKGVNKEQLLQTYAESNGMCDRGKSHLYYSVNIDNVPTVLYLLNIGANIHTTYESLTILHVACRDNAMKVIPTLIDAGVAIDAVDQDGMTALHYAAAVPNPMTIEFMLNIGCDINIRDEMYRTPLEVAIQWGLIDNVACFLKYKPRIKAKKVMPMAVKLGEPKIVEMLIRYGVSVDTQDCRKRTLLQLAVESGQVNMVKLLLEQGADVNMTGESNSQLVSDAICGANEEIVRLLIKYGANVVSKDEVGRTPIFQAVRLQQYEIAEELCKAAQSCIIDEEAMSYPAYSSYKKSQEKEIIHSITA